MFWVMLLGFLFFSLLPCFLVWVIASKFFPQRYKLGSWQATLICLLLSFITGAILHLELEGGALSGIVAIFVFSFIWALILVFVNWILARSRKVGSLPK
jgi:hypothetical protein